MIYHSCYSESGRKRFICGENRMLYLQSMWKVQIILMVIKVVMITLLQTAVRGAQGVTFLLWSPDKHLKFMVWRLSRVRAAVWKHSQWFRTYCRNLIWCSWLVYLKQQLSLDLLKIIIVAHTKFMKPTFSNNLLSLSYNKMPLKEQSRWKSGVLLKGDKQILSNLL